jgi:hypothetical protein
MSSTLRRISYNYMCLCLIFIKWHMRVNDIKYTYVYKHDNSSIDVLWDLRCPALAPLSQLLRSHCPNSEHSVNNCHLSIWKTFELRNSRVWANLRGEFVAKGRISHLTLKVYSRKISFLISNTINFTLICSNHSCAFLFIFDIYFSWNSLNLWEPISQ